MPLLYESLCVYVFVRVSFSILSLSHSLCEFLALSLSIGGGVCVRVCACVRVCVCVGLCVCGGKCPLRLKAISCMSACLWRASLRICAWVMFPLVNRFHGACTLGLGRPRPREEMPGSESLQAHPQPVRPLFVEQDEHTAATDNSRTGAHCPAGEEQAHITEEACISSGLFSEKRSHTQTQAERRSREWEMATIPVTGTLASLPKTPFWHPSP